LEAPAAQDIAMTTERPPHHRLRSAGALLAGIVTVVALSLATDVLARALGWMPAPDTGPPDSHSLLLAFAYRSIYGVLGAYVVARLAPYAPMAHALICGALGLVLGAAGAVARWDIGSHWYPVALALTAVPYAWAGGRIYTHSRA
jgi:hypothetical protein